jgi:nitrogen regulatory protein P-II 1
MKLITAIIRPEKLQDVKLALFRIGVSGITLSRVSGHGGERDVVTQYRGDTVVLEFHDKVRLEMACSDAFVSACIDAIATSARTGNVGDGKIFVQPLDEVVRIRTGERDVDALTPINADTIRDAHGDPVDMSRTVELGAVSRKRSE